MIDLASGSPDDKPVDEVLRLLPRLPGGPPLTAHGFAYNSAGSLRIAIIRPGGVSLKPYDR
jgi:hypothetical protein